MSPIMSRRHINALHIRLRRQPNMKGFSKIAASWLFYSSLWNSTHASAPVGPWDAFNFSPTSRTIRPVAVFRTMGDVNNPAQLMSLSGKSQLSGNGSYVTLDFGKEVRVTAYHPACCCLFVNKVGGLVSLNVQPSSNESTFSLSFAESRMFVSPLTSDDSNAQSPNMSFDGVLPVAAPLTGGFWTMPTPRLRGGFRFLTIVSNSNASVSFSNVSVALSFSPNTANLRDYSGYFHAKDPVFHDEDFLTKIWYAGAYTVQTNVLALDQGRTLGIPSPGAFIDD